MLNLKDNISTIFIMLGQNCNLNCKYCMQHTLINTIQDKSVINDEIFDFVIHHAEKQSQPIDIRFYGGEPLLYLNDIKDIVFKLKEANVSFSIITNGKLLSKDIVEFFNNNKFTGCAVSWDGKNVLKTRHYDVFQQKEDLLLQIKNLNIDGVISAYNSLDDYIKALLPYQEKYFKLHQKIFPFFEEIIMDAGACFSDLIDFDYNKVYQQTNSLINNMINSATVDNDKLTIRDRMYLLILTMLCQQLNDNNEYYMKSYCGNGIYVLNLDLEGNLYQCHNNWIKIGSIYDDYTNYIEKAKKLDDMAAKNFIDSKCKDCTVLSLCKGGCPLVSNKIRQFTDFCRIRQTMFEPIINFINDALSVHGDFNKLKGKY